MRKPDAGINIYTGREDDKTLQHAKNASKLAQGGLRGTAGALSVVDGLGEVTDVLLD